nr:hypothetical protein [Chitinophagaceae bacterium]
KDKFAANPYFDPDILSKIKLHSPTTGMINGKKGDTIHFKFEYTGTIEKLQVNTNLYRNAEVWGWEQINKRKKVWVQDTFALKRQRYTPFVKTGNLYEFDYVIPENSLYYLDILFDFQRVMRFKVVIVKPK